MKHTFSLIIFLLTLNAGYAQQQLATMKSDSAYSEHLDYVYLLKLEEGIETVLRTIGEKMTKELQLRYNEIQKIIDSNCITLHHQKLLEKEIKDEIKDITHLETYLTDSLRMAKISARQYLKTHSTSKRTQEKCQRELHNIFVAHGLKDFFP